MKNAPKISQMVSTLSKIRWKLQELRVIPTLTHETYSHIVSDIPSGSIYGKHKRNYVRICFIYFPYILPDGMSGLRSGLYRKLVIRSQLLGPEPWKISGDDHPLNKRDHQKSSSTKKSPNISIPNISGYTLQIIYCNLIYSISYFV